jgi:hypothetical protein
MQTAESVAQLRSSLENPAGPTRNKVTNMEVQQGPAGEGPGKIFALERI